MIAVQKEQSANVSGVGGKAPSGEATTASKSTVPDSGMEQVDLVHILNLVGHQLN
jgi:hypothetical protein